MATDIQVMTVQYDQNGNRYREFRIAVQMLEEMIYQWTRQSREGAPRAAEPLGERWKYREGQ